MSKLGSHRRSLDAERTVSEPMTAKGDRGATGFTGDQRRQQPVVVSIVRHTGLERPTERAAKDASSRPQTSRVPSCYSMNERWLNETSPNRAPDEKAPNEKTRKLENDERKIRAQGAPWVC